MATQDKHRDQVDGSSWDIGSTVTMTIDDVSNGPGVDLEFTQIAHETDVELITVSFYLEDYDLKPGGYCHDVGWNRYKNAYRPTSGDNVY